MLTQRLQFAATPESASGIGAFNLNVKAFLFQLLTFVLVLLILRRWVFPKLVATLEQRREVLEKSLTQAKKTEEALARAESKAEEILAKARSQADEALAEAKAAAASVISEGEEAAAKRAAMIIKDAEARLDDEREKLRVQLRGELAELVADATEKVVQQKLDTKQDMALIERLVKGVLG